MRIRLFRHRTIGLRLQLIWALISWWFSRFDAESGELLPHGAAAMKPGAGPRHLVFNADNTVRVRDQ